MPQNQDSGKVNKQQQKNIIQYLTPIASIDGLSEWHDACKTEQQFVTQPPWDI